MGHAFPGVISHTAAVTAPALTVMAIILFTGKVSGAHLNPAVSIAFALRRDFPWWPGPRLHHRAAGLSTVLQRISAVRPTWITGGKSSPRPVVGIAFLAFEEKHVITQEDQ